MRRTTRALATLLVTLAVLMLVAPAPAHAADTIPGPIDEILDVPSRVVKSATGSPIGDTVMMMLKGQRWVAGGGSVVPAVPVAPPAVPKPITAPQAFARSGSALTAFLGAWALTAQGELVFTAIASGSSYEDVFCGRPDWYQGVTSFVSLSLAPDCMGTVTIANNDVTAGTSLVYTGTTISYLGNRNSYGCLSGYTPKTGYNMVFWSTNTTGLTGYPRWDTQNVGAQFGIDYCKVAFPTANGAFVNASSGNFWGMPMGWRRASDNAIVAQSVTSTPNPSRTARCKIKWEDGTTTTGTGSAYTETGGLPLSASGLGCEQAYVSKPGHGPDLMPDEITVESDKAGAITEIAKSDVPAFAPDERKAFETGNGHGLVLEKITGVTVSSCMTWAADCSNWWADTDEGTTTGTYRCTYAGEIIALVECGAYRHTFDTRTANPTITDPTTGEEVGWSAQPNTGNSLNPGVGPGTGANPSAECFATGWSEIANPVDWVMVPVKCALVWAFVPRAANVESGQDRIETNWRNSTLGQLAGTIAGVSDALEELGAGNCGGLIVGLPVPGAGGEMTIANHAFLPACPGDLFDDVAPLVYWLFSGLLLVGGWAMTKKQVDNFVGNS